MVPRCLAPPQTHTDTHARARVHGGNGMASLLARGAAGPGKWGRSPRANAAGNPRLRWGTGRGEPGRGAGVPGAPGSAPAGRPSPPEGRGRGGCEAPRPGPALPDALGCAGWGRGARLRPGRGRGRGAWGAPRPRGARPERRPRQPSAGPGRSLARPLPLGLWQPPDDRRGPQASAGRGLGAALLSLRSGPWGPRVSCAPQVWPTGSLRLLLSFLLL